MYQLLLVLICVVDANNDRKRDSPDPWQRQLASGLGHQRHHFKGSVRLDEVRKQESVRVISRRDTLRHRIPPPGSPLDVKKLIQSAIRS